MLNKFSDGTTGSGDTNSNLVVEMTSPPGNGDQKVSKRKGAVARPF